MSTMFSQIALLTTFVAYTCTAHSSSYTYCDDYRECENDTISTSYAACYGYQGCKYSDIDSSHTLGYGELACYDADIDSTYTYSYGHYGTYSSSLAAYHVYAYGYKTTSIADIEPYDSELNIYFYGYYAGWKASVSCYSGDTCHLYCGSSSGCYGVDFYCYSGATCYYDCSGDNVCPTTYTGVESELTYVTKAGTGTSTSGDYLSQAQGEAEGEEDNENTEQQDPDAESIPGADADDNTFDDDTFDDDTFDNDDDNSKFKSDVVIVTGLTDDEINDIKKMNQMEKDNSLDKLEELTVKDTNEQLKMTLDMEFFYTGEFLKKAQEERDNEKEKEREQDKAANREEMEEKELIKIQQKDWYNNKKHQKNENDSGSGNGLLFGISLDEYGIGLIVDVFIVAAIMQGYNYYNKAKEYQQI